MADVTFQRWTRDLHLYAGLFASPFVLVFSISVFVLNHAKVPPDAWSDVRTVAAVPIPDGLRDAQGRSAVDAAQAIAAAVGLDGEVGFTRFDRQTNHFVFPISTPRREASVDVDVVERSAVVSRRSRSLWESLAYLHKMPGPHNAAIRGNWWPTVVWRWWADATVYLILFISITGLCIWWTLRAERRLGLVIVSAGLLTLLGCIGALFY